MKYFLFLFLFLFSGCEYQYRYYCQDPKNWKKTECNNEACKVEGECTEDVLGKKNAPL